MKAFLCASSLICAAPTLAAQVQVAPATIYLQPAGPGGYNDLVVQSVGVRADEGESFTIDSVTIELLAGGQPIESRIVPGKQMAAETGGLVEAPLPAFTNAQLLSEGGMNAFFRAPTVAAKAEVLKPGEALFTMRHYFASRAPVDAVRVTMAGKGTNGGPISAVRTVPVQQRKSTIDYRSPLSGSWLMQALPSLQSHHRFNPPTEFAVDFMKVDGEGRIYHDGTLKAENYYGYGAPVMAAADGVVVRIVDGAIQDRAAATRRSDESPQAAGQRIGAYNMAQMKKDFVRAVAGNLVVIKHEKNEAIEYSSYGHLQAGIKVHEGQKVKQGEVLGLTGDTGDSPTVHLHFQANAGPDPFTSASLPVRFSDQRPVNGNLEPGRFVSSE